MTCKESLHLIDAYLDGELELATAIRIARHAEECPSCAAQHQRQRALSFVVRRSARYFAAPPQLRERLVRALPHDNERTARSAIGAQLRQAWDRLSSARWLQFGAGFASACVLAFSVTTTTLTSSADDVLTREAVASHVRSMIGDHLHDVASSDQHTVKPWLSARLDYSPPVRDFAEHGFPLVGGRLDYLEERQVAALIYRHRQHVVNVFVWPATKAGDVGMRNASLRGYEVVSFERAGMAYRMVSDLNRAELSELAALLGQ